MSKQFELTGHQADLKSLVKSFYESIDTPVSLSLWLLFEAGEHEQLVRREIDPLSYNDRESFQLDLAAISYLRKYQGKGLSTGLDTRRVCLEKFAECELQCEATNSRFRNLASSALFKGACVELLNATQRKICQILGTYKFEDFFALASWGPGATTSVTGVDTSPARKFRDSKHCSWKLYTAVKEFLPIEYPHWFSNQDDVQSLELRDCSKLLTVPKNAKTDRPICVEPDLNVWFQKSIGTSIRRRLARAGFDLDSDQGNKDAAFVGSLNGDLVTVDFSSASDTIAKLVVQELLPADWYFVMDLCRTPCYADPVTKKSIPFEKFSSMGNGYTFELESLIFVSMALAVHEYLDLPIYSSAGGKLCRSVNIFGDDVTLDVRGYRLFQEFSSFMGFTVSTQKSFSTGYFRESCGSYFWNGIDVKPIFLKEELRNVKDLYKAANRLCDLSHRLVVTNGRSGRFTQAHSHLIRRIPKNLRFFGPRELGDCVIYSNIDEAAPSRIGRYQFGLQKPRQINLDEIGFEGWLVKCLIDSPVTLTRSDRGVYNARLRYPSKESNVGNDITLRRVTKMVQKTVLVSQWYNFGPWIG